MKYITIGKNAVFFKGKSYPIVFVPKKEFREKFKDRLWYYLFCRGYTTGGVIYIREGTWLGLEKLIVHEIGHILGYKHTWNVYIMHPSWIGRWFWKWNKDDSI